MKQVRYYKRYAHRKYARTAQKSSEEKKPQTEVADASGASELPVSVVNANARMRSDVTDNTARAMTARANALLTTDQPAEAQGAVTTIQVVEADQLNEADKTLQEPTPPSQTTSRWRRPSPSQRPRSPAPETRPGTRPH